MLLRTIETFLRTHNLPATKFGRLAAHDPRFVLDLRMGREPRHATKSRVEHFMNKWRADFRAGRANRVGDRRTRAVRSALEVHA